MTATLLLVDDDAMNRDALSRRLTGAGYSVVMAESGSQALSIIAEPSASTSCCST